MENSVDVQELIREVLPVCQTIELQALTYHAALLRLLSMKEKVCGYVQNEVTQTLSHRQRFL